MSAFLCTDDHFKALAVFAVTGRQEYVDPRYVEGFAHVEPQITRPALASLYANCLQTQNVRSVDSRYHESNAVARLIVTYADTQDGRRYHLPPVTILKLCDCLEYQSCETEDYRTTPAFALLTRSAAKRSASWPGTTKHRGPTMRNV